MKRGPAAKKPPLSSHYGDLRTQATTWWALHRARIRLTQAIKAGRTAGWSVKGDRLSEATAALAAQERAAARAASAALAGVYPVIASLVSETPGLGGAVALFCGLVPPLRRIEAFPGFPNPSALWAYCGLSAERRAKCDRRARMLAIAYLGTPAIIQPAWHELYAARRAATVDREWQKAHAHRDAIRYVAKRILKHLWLCRLPSGNLQDSLAPMDQISAAGAASSVGLPPDTLASLENPHDGAAPVAQPSHGLSPLQNLTAPEPVVQSERGFPSDRTFTAPEPAAPPLDHLPTEVALAAPEPVAQSEIPVQARRLLTAPEPDAPPSVALTSDQLISTPDAA